MMRKRSSQSARQPMAPRKPRILVAGEFSSGKTLLVNGLAGDRVLPSNVTATALPPVWLVHGTPALMKVGDDGKGVAAADLTEIDLDHTRYCILARPAPILDRFQIIDTPGNSDPNMSAESWQRMLDFADMVVWCTNATQAWRQSEKAVWNTMPARLKLHALLIVTHADLLTDARDAEKVQRRVEREAGPFFDEIRMASLLDPTELESIAALLVEATSSLGQLSGAPSEFVETFAASHAVAPEAQPQTPKETKKTSRPLLRQGWGRRKEAAPEPQATADRDGGAIVPLRTVTSAPAAEVPEEARVGRCRATWDDVSRGVDRSDPKALLAAVESLIAKMDSPQGERVHECKGVPPAPTSQDPTGGRRKDLP